MITALRAGIAYFAVTFTAAFLIGAIRQTVLVPRLGAFKAVLIELPIILMISWIAAHTIVRRLHISASLTARLAMGALAFVLLQIAELGLAVTLFGMSAVQYLHTLATPQGLLGLAGQIGFGLIPLIVARNAA